MDYAGLKQAVSDFLDRSDLSAHIDTFIDLAEARHKREIRIRQMLVRLEFTIDARFYALPADFLDAKHLRVVVPSATQGRHYLPNMDEVSFSEITEKSQLGTGCPRYYAVHEEIEFDIAPDQDYDGELLYYQELTALSDDNTTNALIERAPDAYLYSALAESAPFLMNDERIPVWEGRYALAREGLNVLDRKRSGPLVSRVHGGAP